MHSRHSERRRGHQVPVAAAACFFVAAVLFSGYSEASPEANARKAVEEAYTFPAEENPADPGTADQTLENDHVGISELILDDIPAEVGDTSRIERVSVKNVELISTDEGEGGERSYHYKVDYDIVLDKGNDPVTPVIPDSEEGEITVFRDGIFGWKTEEIQ